MLSHAWPVILVLVLVFGGQIARSLFKTLFGGLAGAAGDAMAQLPTQVDGRGGPEGAIASHNADAVRLAVARAAARRAGAGAGAGAGALDVQIPQEALDRLNPALAALITGAVAVAKTQQPAARGQAAAKPQKPAHQKPAHAPVSGARHTGMGAIAIAAPLVRLKAQHRLPVMPPLTPLAARPPLAPISLARY